ncbi:hypothetical protein AAC387_Pa06g0697 [Persea americana]
MALLGNRRSSCKRANQLKGQVELHFINHGPEKIKEGKDENLLPPKQQSSKRPGEVYWTLATIEIFDVCPVNCLPITGLGDSIAPLAEILVSTPGEFQPSESANKGWISIIKTIGSGKTYQLHRTVPEVAADDKLEECEFHSENSSPTTLEDGESDSNDWLKSHIVVCGKAAGISVGNSGSGRDSLIRFAQDREESNHAARANDRAKKNEKSKKRIAELKNLVEL